MNDNFEINLNEWRQTRLSAVEKAELLERILFATPVPSPYARFARAFAYVKKPAVLALSLAIVLSASVASASQAALPGDVLYGVKTKVIEPLRTALAFTPEKKLELEGAKVERRLAEAEALAEKDSLDDRKAGEIEKNIEKSSVSFSTAAEKISRQAATTSEKQREKAEELKNNFRHAIEKRSATSAAVGEQDAKKIERLKSRAVKALDEGGDKENGRDSGRGRKK